MRLRYHRVSKAPDTTYLLEGFLDEGAKEVLLELTDEVASGQLTLDLSGLQRVNSLGLAQFISALRTLRTRTSSVRFIRCSGVTMEFLQMLPGCHEGVEVVSGECAMVCTKCEALSTQCAELDAELQPRNLVPAPCPECGGPRKPDLW